MITAVRDVDGIALVTADHGNAEQMLTADGQPHTAHTTNPVPLILVGADGPLRAHGRLADLAPTVLTLLDVPVPPEMSGEPLVG